MFIHLEEDIIINSFNVESLILADYSKIPMEEDEIYEGFQWHIRMTGGEGTYWTSPYFEIKDDAKKWFKETFQSVIQLN